MNHHTNIINAPAHNLDYSRRCALLNLARRAVRDAEDPEADTRTAAERLRQGAALLVAEIDDEKTSTKGPHDRL